jgi:hypothetical protein
MRNVVPVFGKPRIAKSSSVAFDLPRSLFVLTYLVSHGDALVGVPTRARHVNSTSKRHEIQTKNGRRLDMRDDAPPSGALAVFLRGGVICDRSRGSSSCSTKSSKRREMYH